MANMSVDQLKIEANAIPVTKRKNVLANKNELELHKLLKELFEAMEHDLEVVITHGPNEYGKDLVLIRRDSIGATTRAVVVKSGDVKATAGGAIDTIKAQVDMCLKHPYNPTGLDEYRITEVLIATNGKISENAKERLAKEFAAVPIQFYDLSKLVLLFTEHYPRVFLGGWEYDFLTKAINELDKCRDFSGQWTSLSQLFVEPLLRKISISSKTSGDFSASREKVKYVDLNRILQAKGRLALVGEAGCGKSTILKKMVVDAMRRSRESLSVNESGMTPIPIICSASHLLELEVGDVSISQLREVSGYPDNVEIDAVFVDGLDEVSREKRQTLDEVLRVLSEEQPLKFIISSRCADYFETAEWHTYEVSPFSTGQAITLCERAAANDTVVASLKRGLEDIGKRISLTPLAVFLLLEIIQEHQEVPASLTELYEQYIDNVLGKYDKDKGIESLFEYEMKKRFLAELAESRFVQKHADSVSLESFESFGHSFFEDYEWPWSNWALLLDELKRSSLVFIDDQSNELRFRHRSFLEFFAAYALYADAQGDGVGIPSAIAYYFNPQWSDIAFYYFGLKKSMSIETIDRILAAPESGAYELIQKMRLGRLMQACWHSRADAKRYGLLASCKYAAKIRNSFLEDVLSESPSTPLIIADFILVSIANDSYKSIFLEKQISAILQNDDLRDDDLLLGAMCLYCASASYFDSATQIKISTRLMDVLKERQDRQLEGRGFFYLLIAAGTEKSTQKAVNRRLKKYAQRYSSVLKGLLPAPKTVECQK